MKPVLIIKNITHEGAGIFENILKEKNIPYLTADLSRGEDFPDGKNHSAVVVCGGPDSANDQNEKIRRELLKIQEIISLEIPYLGICLGMQLLVKAAGGSVTKCPVKEIGFKDHDEKPYTVILTEKGKKDPLFQGLPGHLPVFQLHGETVELTGEMHFLGEGELCRNQAVRIGKNAWGLQCHFEMTDDMFELLLKEDDDLIKMDTGRLRKDFQSVREAYTANGVQIFENFLKII